MHVAFPIELLSNCTGMNAIFLRSSNMPTYKESFPKDVRGQFKDLGDPATLQIEPIVEPPDHPDQGTDEAV